jgi:protein TonB
MFETSLIELSGVRVPVLERWHWLASFVVGAVLFTAALFVIPMVSFGVTSAVLNFQATVIGLTTACWALFFFYIWTDARREGFHMLWILAVVPHLLGFLVYLFYSAAKTGDWRRASMPIAYIVQAVAIGALILYPLIKMEALPRGQLMSVLVAPPPPPPPPPPPRVVPMKRLQRKVTVEDLMRAPTKIPERIKVVEDEAPPQPTAGIVGGVPGGLAGGAPGGIIGGLIAMAAAPPPPPPKPKTPKRIRVGGQVVAAKLISKPDPIYPPLAKMARIQGMVKLEAIIARGGTVKDLKVISGHPLLVKSALDAVQRWRYQPTLLNGEPVEVITEIDVHFRLTG